MARWLQKTFDSGVRRGLEAAEDRAKKEASTKPKDVYSKVRKEYNRSVENEMFGEKTKFPKGMEPVGDKGFYSSPMSGNFDPRDCSNPRNSTSPWCGYNPVTTKPLDLGIDLKLDNCGGFIKVRGSLGFIDLPPTYAGYLKPECREDYKKENLKEAPEAKTVEPGLEVVPPPDNFPPTPSSDLPNLAPKCLYIVALGSIVVFPRARVETNRGTGFNYVSSAGLFSIFPSGHSWQYSSRESTETHYANGDNSTSLIDPSPIGEPSGGNIISWGSATYTGTKTITGNSSDRRVTEAADDFFYTGAFPTQQRTTYQGYQGWQAADIEQSAKFQFSGGESQVWKATKSHYRDYTTNNNANLEACWMSRRYGLYPAIENKTYDKTNRVVGGRANPNLFAGTGENILRYLAESVWTNETHRANQAQLAGIPLSQAPKVSYYILDIYEFPCPTSPAWNYSPPKRDCMPCCCNDTKTPQERRNDDEILKLLREIRKFIGDFPQKVEVYDNDPDVIDRQKENVTLNSIAKAIEHFQKQINFVAQGIGIPDFPVIYPDSLVKPVAMSGVEMVWDWFTPDKERRIKSLAQLQDWGFDQMSAIFGQWHQYIEYEDDKGKKQKISYPDIGTLLRELVKMLTSTIQALGLQTDIELKTLQESTNASLMIAEALKRVTDIQDYLDYPTQMRKGELPAQVTPKSDVKNVTEYLKPSQLKYQWDDWTPNQGQSLQEQLNEIRLILNVMRASQGGE